MTSRLRSPLVATFLGVLVLVLLVAAAAGAVLAPPAWSEPATTHEASTFDPANNVVTPLPEDGTIDVEDGDERRVVVIDLAHRNAMDKADVQPLVDGLVANGHEVRFFGSVRTGITGNLNSTLRGADAYVTVQPTVAYDPGEVNGVTAFAERGGRVLMVAEPARPTFGLADPIGRPAPGGISARLTELGSRFDVSVDTGYLYNVEENANNFRHVYAETTGPDDLTDGVDRVVLQRATAISTGDDAQGTLAAIDGTRLSSTRAAGESTVLARNGDVAVLGDASILAPGNVRLADNEVLVGNLIEFLVTGDKQGPAPPASDGSSAGASGPGSPGGSTEPPTPPTPTPTPSTPDNGTSG